MKKLQGKITDAPGEPFTGGVDLSIVAALAKIAGHHDLSEVEIEHDGLRVRVARERRAAALHVQARFDVRFEGFEVFTDSTGDDAAQFAVHTIEIGKDDQAGGERQDSSGVEKDRHGLGES